MVASAPGSLLPAEGITYEVPCRTAPDADPLQHPITIGPDWQVTTPHDLEVERIGVALGGTLTCVDLVDRDLPAARALIEHTFRTRPAAIVQQAAQAWVAAAPASGCACEGKRWPTAAEAAAHLRTNGHWAAVHRTRSASVILTAARHRRAVGLDHTPQPVTRSATEGLLTEPDATVLLWEAGVPFDLVPELCRELSPAGIPIPTRIVVAHLYAPQEWAVLEQFVPYGEVVLTWAAQHRTARDQQRPHERLTWVEADIPLPTIDRIFSGMAYDLVHAQAYAAATGVSLAQAAAVLGRWQASGTTPEVRDLVGLHEHDPHVATSPSCAPARAAVERTVKLAAGRGVRVTPTDAAIAVALLGTAPEAAAHLARTRPRTPTTQELP